MRSEPLADPAQLHLLRRSIEERNYWRRTNPSVEVNLENARLNGERFASADLSGAHLQGADLRFADLSASQLDSANLVGANLSGTNFELSVLYEANLTMHTSRGRTLILRS